MADASKFQIADGAILNVKDAVLRAKFDDSGKLLADNLPIASETTIGAIKVGGNLLIASDGTLSATAAPYILPAATATNLGGIKIGNNLTITADGLLSADDYVMIPATIDELGGIKSGQDITIDNNGLVTVGRADKATTAQKLENTCLITVKTQDNLISGSTYFDFSEPVQVTLNNIPQVTTVTNGLMSIADKTKLDSIENGANNYVLPIASTTQLGGIKSGSTSGEGGITVSSDGLALINNYGHRHKLSEVDDLETKLNDKIDESQKGSPNGVAELDSNGKIPPIRIPGSLYKVVQGYYHEDNFYVDPEHTILIKPDISDIYVDLHTNKTYRWSGSVYVEISASLALGETETTAYRGDRGKIAYDHSQLTDGTNPHATTFANIIDNIAKTDRLGGIKVGANLAITDEGVLSGNYANATATNDGLLSKEDYPKFQSFDQRITNLEQQMQQVLATLLLKADLVNGRVEKTQLPKLKYNTTTGNVEFDFEVE